MGGMSKKDREIFGDKETDAPEPDNFKKSKTKKEAADKALIEAGMEIAGSKSPSKDKKPVKKKAGGKVMMKNGGSVKKCKRDGIAKRGKTRCKGSK